VKRQTITTLANALDEGVDPEAGERDRAGDQPGRDPD